MAAIRRPATPIASVTRRSPGGPVRLPAPIVTCGLARWPARFPASITLATSLSCWPVRFPCAIATAAASAWGSRGFPAAVALAAAWSRGPARFPIRLPIRGRGRAVRSILRRTPWSLPLTRWASVLRPWPRRWLRSGAGWPRWPLRLVALVRQRHLAIVWCVIPEQSLAKAPAFLVARDFEFRARIFMRSARPPGRPTPLSRRPLPHERRTRFFFGLPQASAREPHQHGIGMSRLQLTQRGQELLLRVRAKGCRLALEDDRPVRVAWGHGVFRG